MEKNNPTLLIASDGLWDGKYKDSAKVVKMALSFCQDNLDFLCEKVAEEGKENYGMSLKDDITVIIVSL